jgi:DNA repair protein SbcD/Mre11
MTHAGVDGQLPQARGSSYATFTSLREHIDYVALGHFHKPYRLEDWIFNPGSPETCSMDETAWTVRGAYLVQVDPTSTPKHKATLLDVPRRAFHRFTLPVDSLADPNAVYDAVRDLIQREKHTVDREVEPVVELTLTGNLAFSRYDLDLTYIQRLLTEAWSPIGQPHVINKTVPTEFEVRVNADVARPELERHVLQELLERDARYRSDAANWAEGTLELKRLALGGSPPDAIVAHLRRLRGSLLSPEKV